MPSLLHEHLVEDVIARYADMGPRRSRFKRDLLRCLNANVTDPDDIDGIKEELAQFNRVPDAFAIMPERALVVVFEVSVTNAVRGGTLRDYAELWFDLDCFGWDLVVVEVDQHGREFQLDLCAAWYEFLEKDIKAKPPMSEDERCWLRENFATMAPP
jgi:hypothetical protein